MNIVEWFDVNDKQHIAAWIELGDSGVWPMGFIPPGMDFPMAWQGQIAFKMANAWVRSFSQYQY